MRTFDFRPGRNGWGHAIHGSTFKVAEPRKEKRGHFGKAGIIERVSVMVHCSPPPCPGDCLIYQGGSGTVRTCEIVDVVRAQSVDDMYTLTLEEKPAALAGSEDPQGTGGVK